MYTVVYKSKANPDFKNGEIRRMLMKAKVSNKKNNITGCLIHHNDCFIQIFEGKIDEVKALYDKIKNDERHFDIQTIVESESNNRLWDDWSMAFYDLSDNDQGFEFKRLLLNNHIGLAIPDSSNRGILELFKKEANLILS